MTWDDEPIPRSSYRVTANVRGVEDLFHFDGYSGMSAESIEETVLEMAQDNLQEKWEDDPDNVEWVDLKIEDIEITYIEEIPE